MNPGHVAQVAGLETICFHDPWSEQSIAGELKNELALWLVAVEDDSVIGYVGSQTVLGWTDIMNVAVHPDHRRRGVAEALIRALMERLKQMKCECLTLEVRVSNAGAIALYEKLGFTEVGRRKNYYRNPREDALILRLEFAQK